MSILTDGDAAILPAMLRSQGGFHKGTEWYFRGFVPTPYQWAWHHMTCNDGDLIYDALNTTFIAGIAAGKTRIATASYLADCISIPFFKALNTSVTAKQAELPFDMAMSWIEGNPKMEHLIENISLRPFPVISFKNYSSYEFRTAGLDARFIRGSEYDRINFDESGLDTVGLVSKVLRGRLRGERENHQKRMARLDAMSSPTGALWLMERFDKGNPNHLHFDPANYRSIRVATWQNPHLTKQQINAMMAEYPPDMIDVELGGQFPEFGLSRFPPGHVNACVDQSLYDAAYIALNPEDGKIKPGYRLEEDPRHGITLFDTPYRIGRNYILAGDPGTGNLPQRDAACVAVADATDPHNLSLVYFHWISGRGSYNPFLASYRYAIDKFYPSLKGIDATATQKGLQEIAFENNGITTDGINFSTEKQIILNTLSDDITNHRWSYPPIKGLVTQTSNYTDEGDRKGHPQDTTMALGMLSYLGRHAPAVSKDRTSSTNNRPPRNKRTRRVRRRRP